jgi:hypothetical protein
LTAITSQNELLADKLREGEAAFDLSLIIIPDLFCPLSVMAISSSFVAVFMLIGFFDIFPNSNFQL